MPHKRRSRLAFNPKHRSLLSNCSNDPPPNVNVKSDHGTDMEHTFSETNLLPPPPAPPLASVPAQEQSSQTLLNKYAIPQYNTTIRKNQELEVVQTMPSVIRTQLTPRSKAALAPMVPRKSQLSRRKLKKISLIGYPKDELCAKLYCI